MATITIPNFLTEKVVNGLNTYQYTTINTAMHVIRVNVTQPPASGMTITLSQSGSQSATLATVTLPQSTVDIQGNYILQATANCVSGDVLSVALSSSQPIDKQLNTVVAKIIVKVGSLN